MKLDEKLEECAWVPRPRLAPLRRLGIATVNDLLTHFPRRHEDRSKFVPFPREQSETPVLICGEVTKTSLRRFGGWKKIFEATLQEAEANALSQPLVLRWFNMHYVQKMIATGQRLVVYGKPRLRGQRICLEHPEFEVIEDDEEESIHFQRITPIYPATEGLSQRVFRGLIFHALENLDEDEVETLIPRKHGMGSGREALQQIHFPDSMATLASAREHLAFAEFFALQMMIASRRAENSARAGEPHCGHGALLERFLRALPFDLTAAQERVLAEVRRDLTSKVPMNRLLQGDVGSGKTVVAIGAILLAVEAGYQAALMAPTQILAEQHYAVLGRWLEPLGVRLALRTGARSEDNAPLPLFAAGEIQSPGSAGCQPAVSGSLPETTPGIAEPSYRKRALPHFERPWAKYAITIATRNHRVLSEPARDVVMESILRWNDHRYALFAACVMPDHVHMLIEPMIEREDEEGDPVFFSLSKILHSIKSFTATRVNKIEKATGAVWETESFDRMIRSESDLQEKFRYVTGNPWTSGVAGAGDAYRWVWYHGIAWERGGLAHAEMFAASCREQQAGSLRYPERNDPPQILIGTHALLYEGVSFEKLGLVVIDEQHKFGVSQRARLTSREPAPDVL
ncbi:MAG: DEAD/DEAH box helicase, partial [Chthoniobacterales bacterium]